MLVYVLTYSTELVIPFQFEVIQSHFSCMSQWYGSDYDGFQWDGSELFILG